MGKWLEEKILRMANKHMEQCPVSLAIREMQIKTIGRYCYILGMV